MALHHGCVGFTPDMPGSLNSQKFINVIGHINRIKEETLWLCQ